jgi:MFS family permease
MLASITPLGERGRGSNWALTTTMYIGGSLAGGAASGALAGAFGSVAMGSAPIRLRLALLAAALLVGLAWELARGSVPGPRRQVNEQWLDRYRGWVYGLGFGAQLGAGVTTVVVSSAVYAGLVAALVSASAQAGLLIGAVVGALRGSTVLTGASIASPQRLIAFHERMRRLHSPVRTVALVVQLTLAGLTAAAVVTGG